MNIVTIMMGRNLGGLEQAFLDYNAALTARGHRVMAIMHPNSKLCAQAEAQNTQLELVSAWGQWDIFASMRIRKLIADFAPDAAIAHGNRALHLMHRAAKGICPVIPVANNYHLQHFAKFDSAFTVTEDLRQAAIAKGISPERVYTIPNTIQILQLPPRPLRRMPPVIGAMGRFVEKKGFGDYLQAIAILKERGIEFRAVLGGTGELESDLKQLAEQLGILDVLQFLGWVENKQDFYRSIDVFCLPSLHEPFGIVLLEAFAHKVPVVTTDSEGPAQIATHGTHALIAPRRNPDILADAMAQLLEDGRFADVMSQNAFALVKQAYSMEVAGKKLENALLALTHRQVAA